MNSKQILEALENGGWVITEHLEFGGKRLIRFEGDKGRKLSGVSWNAIWLSPKIKLVKVDGKTFLDKTHKQG